MNRGMIRYIIGTVLKIEAALLLLPCLYALIYRENEGFIYLITALMSLVLGVLLTVSKPESTLFYLKEGCIATSGSWIALSMIGALPFVLTGEIPNYIDALFETVSGFTTTGASILTNVEALSHTSLFWRSFTHWIGGMGVLVFLLAIVPLSGGSNINLMRAESPGPSVGKLMPQLKNTARALYAIYIAMTGLEFIFLIAGKMPVFDALCTSFGTAGTGGFGIKNDSIGGYSVYLQWVVAIFMILFGVNFNAYYLILLRQAKKAFRMEEVRVYFGIIAISTAVIFFNIRSMFHSAFDALTNALFTVGSIITTTGFSTVDFDLWPSLSKTILVILMFIGACAGSTGGGVKVSRFIIMFKTFVKEANSYMHPKSIKKIKMDGKPIEHDVVRSVNVFIMTYITMVVASVLVVSAEGKDLTTNFTAVAATINNIGPGLSQVGPTQNFADFTAVSKIVFIIDMLAGRLELFPLIILFHPAVWRDLSDERKVRKRKLALRRAKMMHRQNQIKE